MEDEFYFSEDEDDDTINVPALADSETETPGMVVGIEYAKDAFEPQIKNGMVQLLPAVEAVMRNDSYVPEPGEDGWVMTLYQPMMNWNGDSDIASFRQLMRVKDNVLEVSWQYQVVRDGLGLPWELLI